MALKKATKTIKAATPAAKPAYGRFAKAAPAAPAQTEGSKFIRVTGLFNTKTEGNLIGTTQKDVLLPSGATIPAETTFLVMESKPYNGQPAKFPYVLVIPPPRD